MKPIENIEAMISNVSLYAEGWEVVRAGTAILLNGTQKTTKNSFLVIRPIKEVTSSQPMEEFTPHVEYDIID